MATPEQASRTSRPGRESTIISSRDNRWLKLFRMALRGGLPTADGYVGVEGVRLVEEALRSGNPIQAVLFGESGERHHERLVPLIGRPELAFPILRTTDRLFEGIADTDHPQGVAALVKPRETSFDEFVRTPDSVRAPLLVILAGVQDPGNVGAIIRTAAAFGVTGAATCASGVSGTANPYSPKALRASAGAALHLPVLAGMSLPILLAQLKVAGIRALASSIQESPGPPSPSEVARFSASSVSAPLPSPQVGAGLALPATSVRENAGSASAVEARCSASPPLAPWEIDWRQPVALLVGNEGAGLPEEIERSADVRIRIPMSGEVESLNAAAAAAIFFYEAARQRNTLPASRISTPAARGAPSKS